MPTTMPTTRSVLLLPSYEQVLAYRKQQARTGGAASFRCDVATLASWVEGLWDLFGDGRAIISPARRDVMLSIALSISDNPEEAVCADVVASEGAAGRRRSSGTLPSPGVVALAARLSRSASGLDEFESALSLAGAADAEGDTLRLSSSERAVLTAIARYRRRAARAGFVELGEAMAALPRAIAALCADGDSLPIVESVVFRPFPEATLPEARFLVELVDAGVVGSCEILPARTDIACAVAEARSELRFAFPSGRYAEPMLLVKLIEQACAEAQAGGAYPSCSEAVATNVLGAELDSPDSEPNAALTFREAGDEGDGSAGSDEGDQVAQVVVVAQDPIEVYESIAAACAARGLSCAVRGSRPFFRTTFGVAYAAMRRCVLAPESTCDDLSDLTDVLLSPFSGFSTERAQDIDAKLRNGRHTTMGEARAEQRAASEAFSWLEELATDPEADVLAGAIEDAARRMPGVTEAWRREQLGALAALREATSAVRALCEDYEGIDAGRAMELVDRELDQAFVDVSRSNGCERQSSVPDVLIVSPHAAAVLGKAACSVAIALDMTTAAYPAASRRGAADTLLAKIGLDDSEQEASGKEAPVSRLRVLSSAEPLALQRATLCALLALPTQQLVIERRLFDAEVHPSYPAAVVQELVDCFRADPSAVDDIDNPFTLPDMLQGGMVTRGEEALFENAALTERPQRVSARLVAAPFGTVSKASRARVVLPREIEGGAVLRRPCLSPSQIESYLECPCKWFAIRRLRLDELDCGFGPTEMGNFSHHALNAFYRVFQDATGRAKVTPDSLDEARAIMRTVLDEPFEGLVAASELERRGLDELKAKLLRFLDYEAEFLPGFSPTYLEFEIPDVERVPYAGYEVLGRVDRIDVDARGRAVIIDYKSSVGDDYDLRAANRDYPRKVQALIYARAIERLLGIQVVGAVYVSYGRTLGAAGAYDPDVLSEGALPKMKHRNCRPRAEEGESFSQVLDMTEDRISRALDRMLSGDVAPAPLSDSACSWCPVRSCLERRD